MDEEETIDAVADAIIDYLEWDVWEDVGAFMDNIDSALRLPINKRMNWVLHSHSPCAMLMHETCVAYSAGKTLQEAICRAWLIWKRANDTTEQETSE